MKIKICGIKSSEIAQRLDKLGLDYLGFIYFKKSKRYVGSYVKSGELKNINANKVAVFVDESLDRILQVIADQDFQVVQLHGHETEEFCKELKAKADVQIWKAIGISSGQDLEKAMPYQKVVDAILFDTKTTDFGGSGQSFDWSLLQGYQGTKPFWIAGGLGLETDCERLRKEVSHDLLFGLDFNSKLEDENGEKDLSKILALIKLLEDKKIIEGKML